MSAKRYTEEFKIEDVKQVVERNYKISDVAARLGVTTTGDIVILESTSPVGTTEKVAISMEMVT